MPTFHYKARKGQTETISGHLEAQNQDEAIDMLHREGLLPIAIEERKSSSAGKGSLSAKKIRSKDLYIFSQQLANLNKSGVSLLRALTIIGEQAQNPYLKEIIFGIQKGVKEGRSLSNCLADYPAVFSSFYVAMIKVGEEGGSLKEMLLRIAEYQRSQEELSSKVRTALAYPVVMGVVGLATIVFILTFVMPRITNLFIEAGESLPLPTKILMQASDALRTGWFWILLVVVVAGILLDRWAKTNAGRLSLSVFKLQLPLFGNLILKSELARFAKTLELLLKSGVQIIKAIDIALPILSNEKIRQELSGLKKDLESGSTLGHGLKHSKIVPSIMVNFIVVGEEAGLLEEALRDVAASYEQETDEIIKTLTTLLEPAMILAVGLIVGFIVIAMMLPIFQMDVLAR
ncbi:MAG: type II secretion system F family protein [Candidatus Omnitrophota bacterium]